MLAVKEVNRMQQSITCITVNPRTPVNTRTRRVLRAYVNAKLDMYSSPLKITYFRSSKSIILPQSRIIPGSLRTRLVLTHQPPTERVDPPVTPDSLSTYLLRIMDKEFKNLKNCTITEVDSFGTLDSSSDPPAWNTGLMSIVANNQTDVAMAAFTNNVSKIEQDAMLGIIRYSTPFVSNPYKGAAFSLGFPPSSKAGSQFQVMINNLKNKRYLESFLIKWFINGTSLWSIEKQKTPYTPTQICQTM
ncbi:uncharacterized protein LOC110861131 [Folsomia candida]|uniref:uncharacterized protein LOC110861131 n=1 Tax=Folsomia candida TaxID=158441 RepID=UPI001604A86B|nr:uncharacterized protein LOC110861131 [Folsomia candida]